MREAGVVERSALTALPAVHGLPEEDAGTCNGRGELRRQSFGHQAASASRKFTYHKRTYYARKTKKREKIIARPNNRFYHSPSRTNGIALAAARVRVIVSRNSSRCPPECGCRE
jgi:hypothetical protein